MSAARFATFVLALGVASSGSILLAEDEPTSELGLVIGEYRLPRTPVIDGDTIRVEGIRGTLRLLAIDSEETFRSEADRRNATLDFDRYMREKRRTRERPIKAATPMGEVAKQWAKDFFSGVDVVRLERDDRKEVRGRYGRLLSFVFVEKGGRWLNYNLEAVRAGMSPYFTKYGYSKRFHSEFEAAEREAKAAGRGIWAPNAKAYPDYDERKAWWNARADCIHQFVEQAKARDNHVVLTHWDAPERLERRLGGEVTVLGAVVRIERRKTLVRVLLGRRQNEDLPLIFFDRMALAKSGIAKMEGELVIVRGIVSRFERGKYRTLQIVIERSDQVMSCPPRAIAN